MNQHNYYEALKISQEATEQEIKAAYRKLAFEYHPDRNKGNSHAADKMKSINEAYAVLSDPDKRRQYDMLYQKFGNDAKTQFRRHFTDQDIFKGSDIQHIFEEMARSFGLRGFDDIFKDYHQEYRIFSFQRSGMFGRRENTQNTLAPKNKWQHIKSMMVQKMLGKVTGMFVPQRGGDLYDVIVLSPEFANKGGPFAYSHQAKNKKLVVQIPKSVHNGQLIRLNAMGKDGTHGAGPGDLFLKVKIKIPLLNKLKNLISVR